MYIYKLGQIFSKVKIIIIKILLTRKNLGFKKKHFIITLF